MRRERETNPAGFPKDARGRATLRCGLYYAYKEADTTLYAWQCNEDWVAGERAQAGAQ